MYLEEFQSQFTKLKNVYGEKYFPEAREKIFWERFQRYPGKAWERAVDWVVFNLPALASLAQALEAQLRDIASTGRDISKDDIPNNPRAKELAEYYVPRIKAQMRGFGKLPYDKNQRGEIENRPVAENIKAKNELLNELQNSTAPAAPLDRSGEW